MRRYVLAALVAILPAGAFAQAPEPAAVTQLRGMLGSNVRLDYASATATDVQGSAALTGVVLTKDAETIRIAEARLEGLREDGIARLSLRDIQLQGGGVPMRIGRLDLESLTVRRPPRGQTPKPDALAADLLRIENWQSEGPTPVKIGLVTVENYGAGRQGQVSVTALEVGISGGPVDRVTVARMGYSGLDTAEILTAVIDQRPPQAQPGRSSLDIESVAVTRQGQAVARLGSFSMRGELGGSRPPNGSLALRGLEVLPAPPHAEWMQRLGYDRLGAEARMEATHDPATQTVDMPDLSIELRDVGQIALAFRASHVPENMTPQAAQDIRLISARLRYADLSLFRRWVRTAAARENMGEDAFRQRLVRQANSALAGPTLTDARNAMARFLRGEATVLELSANPRVPLRMSYVQGKPQTTLAGWQNMFGLSLTAR
ncbi:hypothetical protein [Roseococcus sp. YIM B11640]|uniref:hypothetical protein n=1 Tax=Roseococcus sp. YIM B11640 TaxID=3133973 RepID=UPI003C79E076